ncbi:hypothetical protein PPA0652 [Cutibacterium acnes KPA171202]|uniref:Uncharacterized protein n=1 Tax=Cutibacterium acnes (strain DSM 16379 / KPA171202) TaxID=267747 RepID=Q6AA07_CUTAK|nr:hypothetical protein PPA0652 [Cutibacterium acnes KPA171202]
MLVSSSLSAAQPTRTLKRATLKRVRDLTVFLALLQVGFAMPSPSPMTRWALTPPFHPHRLETGSLFSVALSRGSPRVGVTHHPALWSPDFPRQLTAAAITRMARPTANSTDIPASPPQEGLRWTLRYAPGCDRIPRIAPLHRHQLPRICAGQRHWWQCRIPRIPRAPALRTPYRCARAAVRIA